jgi:arginyl-tRNA synthetase
MKMPPSEIALQIRKGIDDEKEEFEDIQTKGPYINFFVNKKILTKNLIEEILKEKDNFGKTILEMGKKFL